MRLHPNSGRIFFEIGGGGEAVVGGGRRLSRGGLVPGRGCTQTGERASGLVGGAVSRQAEAGVLPAKVDLMPHYQGQECGSGGAILGSRYRAPVASG